MGFEELYETETLSERRLFCTENIFSAYLEPLNKPFENRLVLACLISIEQDEIHKHWKRTWMWLISHITPDVFQLYAEKVATRGLCAIAQCESLRYKLIGGLAVRRWVSVLICGTWSFGYSFTKVCIFCMAIFVVVEGVTEG